MYGREFIEPCVEGIAGSVPEGGYSTKTVVKRIPVLRKFFILIELYTICLLIPVAIIWIMTTFLGMDTFLGPQVVSALA